MASLETLENFQLFAENIFIIQNKAMKKNRQNLLCAFFFIVHTPIIFVFC